MTRILFAFLATLPFLPPLAQAQDPALDALEGAWVVQVGNQTRNRFLIVSGAARQQNLVVPKSAIYGWIDGRGVEVGDWKAEIFGDTIKLSYVTSADSLVNVAFKATETSAIGGMLAKDGKKYDVRMTRLENEELVAMRAAAKEAKGAKTEQAKRLGITKNSNISLVYVGADNCPPCKWFTAHYGKDGKGLSEISPELVEARFVYVFQWRFTDPVTNDQLPPDMTWLIQPAANGKMPLRKRGTPFFAAVVDQRVIAQGHGTGALQSLVAPAIKRAVEEKRAAN
jgi:hypothetical protein